MTTQVDLIKQYGLSIRGHLGQHLLIDPNMQQKIVNLLEARAGDTVLEIGPGLGALTGALLNRGFKVIAVEKDEKFVEILREQLGYFGANFKVIHADILDTDIEKILPARSRKKAKLISNLPYYITAPILFHILAARARFDQAVLMMQKEVANRLIASPGSKDYGRLSLALRYAGDVTHAFDVPPGCFTPRPEIDSSVVSIRFHPESSRLKPEQEKALFDLIQAAFSQRRKTLLNVLSHSALIGLPRDTLSQIFDRLKFPNSVRGEELLLKDYLGLLEEMRTAKKAVSHE